MKSKVLHTVWCNISGEAAGEIWHWSLLTTQRFTAHAGMCGKTLSCQLKIDQCIIELREKKTLEMTFRALSLRRSAGLTKAWPLFLIPTPQTWYVDVSIMSDKILNGKSQRTLSGRVKIQKGREYLIRTQATKMQTNSATVLYAISTSRVITAIDNAGGGGGKGTGGDDDGEEEESWWWWSRH